MKRWLFLALPLLVLDMGLPTALGNMGPLPKEGVALQAREVKLIVKVDKKVKQPVLQVPLNLMGGVGGGLAPRSGADAGPRRGAQTVVAGLALTLAFISGGLWLIRRGSGRYLATLVALSLFAAGTSALWANLAPLPGERRSTPAPPAVEVALPTLKLPASIKLTDKLLLEPIFGGDNDHLHLTLIVPKSMVAEKEKIEADDAKSAP